jgi:hypothetical protein
MEHNIVDETNYEGFTELLKKMVHFKISYYAKKYGKFIFRNAMWTDKCKIDADKGTITYFDTDANGYRTATQGIQIAIRKEGETIQ